MEIIAFIWEIALLGIAIYLYLFSRGFIKADPRKDAKAIEFREQNKKWMAPLSLFLAAIMVFNIVLRLSQ